MLGMASATVASSRPGAAALDGLAADRRKVLATLATIKKKK